MSHVGHLDHPERLHKRRASVYQNGKGYYIVVDGQREFLHGNIKWTSLSGVKFRGSHPAGNHPAVTVSNADDMARAIAASLEEAPSATGSLNASTDASNRNVGKCVVCLTEDAQMLLKPCNHLIACQGCASRLVRAPCPVCRKNCTKVERVYF